MAEIIDWQQAFVISLTSAGSLPGGSTPVDPTADGNIHYLSEGDHNIVVSKAGCDTVRAKITVLADGTVSCNASICTATGHPRVEIEGSSVFVYMRDTSTPASSGAVSGSLCAWITSFGGWTKIMWVEHVLEAKYVYMGVPGHSVGFSPVTWDDVLALKYYYIDQETGSPTTGNESASGCGF